MEMGSRSRSTSEDRQGRPPERSGSQNRSDSSRRRSLERRQSEAARGEDVTAAGHQPYEHYENTPDIPQNTYNTLLNQLRPHLSQRFVGQLENPGPLHIKFVALNAINSTKDIQTMDRRREHQRVIDNTPDENKKHMGYLLIGHEIDQLQKQVDQMASENKSAQRQLNLILRWEGHVRESFGPTIGMITGPLGTGIKSIREQTHNMSEEDRLQTQQAWLDRLPDHSRWLMADNLGRDDPARRRKTLNEHIERIERLSETSDIGDMMHKWENMKEHTHLGISKYVTPEIKDWSAREVEDINRVIGEINDAANAGHYTLGQVLEFQDTTWADHYREEMGHVKEEIQQRLADEEGAS